MRNAARLLGRLRIKQAEDHAADWRSNCGHGRGGIRATSQTPMTQTFQSSLGVECGELIDLQARGSKAREDKQFNLASERIDRRSR